MSTEVTLEDVGALITKGVIDGVTELQAKMENGVLATVEAQKAFVAELQERHEKHEARAEAMERAMAEWSRLDPGDLGSGKSLIQWPLPDDLLTSDASTDEERAHQKLSDLLWITHLGTMNSHKGTGARAAEKMLKAMRLDKHPVMTKALDSYTSGGISEWVPTVMSGEFHQQLRWATNILPLFRSINMTAKVIENPANSNARATVYLQTGSENAAYTENTNSPVSSKITWTAEDLAVRRDFSTNADEDSIVSLAEIIRGDLVDGLAYWIDRAILDGDTAGTHMDTAAVGATDPRKAWDGLRDHCLNVDADANVDLSTFTIDNLVKIPANMDEYVQDPSQAVWLMHPNTFYSLVCILKDANNNPVFLPATNAGATNPVITGEIGRLLGFPVKLTGLLRTDLSAYGYYSLAGGYTQNKTVLHLVNTKAFIMGTRREITLETDKDITKGSTIMVATWRGDYQCTQGTVPCVGMGYNIAVV